MLRRLMTWAGVVAIAFVGSAASANTITIGASRDATIFQNNVDNSNGAGPGMFSGTNGAGSPRRGLIDFDIAGNVPAGSTITSVQLTLFLAQVAGGGGGSADTTPRTIELHLLTSNWGEGTTGMGLPLAGSGQGFPANAGDATWNARMFPSTLWGTAGGDFNASASASTLVGQTINDPYVWASTAALVSDVQGWLDSPSTNFGWAVINAQEGVAQDFRAFFTRDAASLQPQLEITFTPVPESSSLMLLFLGTFGLFVTARRG